MNIPINPPSTIPKPPGTGTIVSIVPKIVIRITKEKEMILNIPDSSGNASLDINCVKHKHTVKQQSIMVHDILTYIKDCKNFVMNLVINLVNS